MEHTFVTRDKELMRLSRLLDQAVAGKGQLCFVTGEAGLGKTCLTTEFARRAQQRNEELLVAIGDCNSQTGISDPYLPFREVLGMLTGDVDDRVAQGMTTEENASRLKDFLRVTKRIVMEVGPDLIDIFVPGVGLATKAGVLVAGDNEMLWRRKNLPPAARAGSPAIQNVQDSEQGRIFEQVTKVLLTLAGQRPLILILDDLHWIDESSASLLFHLARRIEGSRILIIGTYRPEEVALDRGEYRHPMAQIVAELKRHYGDLMISLDSMDAAEARRFIDALLDTESNSLDRDFRQRLFERTRGHPLFTRELLRDMQERGALLRDPDGHWIQGSELDWDALPARAEGVIEERINRLPDDLQEILTIASVQGEEFTAQPVQRLMEISERELLAALTRELDRVHRLVVEEGSERVGSTRLSHFRFRHQMFQKYFYDRLGASERELLHENTANVLEELHSESPDRIAIELAHHYQRAGLNERAAQHYLRAGRRAAAMYAYQEARALSARGIVCLDHSGKATSHPNLLLELMLLQGDAQQHAGNVNESMETFRNTAELAIELGAPEAAARAAMGYCEPRWRYNMVDATSVRLLSEALALFGSHDSALRACLIAHLARMSENTRSFEELLAMLDEAIAMARRLDDPGTLLDCMRFRFNLDRDPKRIEERLDLADEMLQLGREVQDKGLYLETLTYRIYDRLAIGDITSCERDLDSMQEIAAELGDPFYTYNAETMRVSGAILTGRFGEAERLAVKAMEEGRRLGVGNVEGVMGVQMFTIRREQGRLAEVAPVVAHFVNQHGAGAAWRPGLTLIYCEVGRTAEAKEQFERLAKNDFSSVPRDALWQTCLSYLAEVCDELQDRQRAKTLYELLLPYAEHTLIVGNAVACLGATSRFLGQLAMVMHRWDDAARHFEHAIEFNGRLNALPWLAHTRYHYARMLLRRNLPQDAERASRLIDEAGDAAEQLGMRGLSARIRAALSDA